MKKPRIVVGISGGIDSAFTALTLKKRGYEVIGVHLRLIENSIFEFSHIDRIQSAIDIPITTLNGIGEFKKVVIENFRNDHLAGRTPSPCATCNPDLKWKLLNKFAKENDANMIATGHYIQKVHQGGLWYLKKANDSKKDQSYFLWALSQEIISKMHPPLGEYNKHDIKILAKKTKLSFLLNQNESTGLCFANGDTYPELLKRHIPELSKITEGRLVNKDNKVIGSHHGYVYYTIGQKRGLELHADANNSFCVIGIEPENNLLIVGEDNDLYTSSFIINNCYFTNKSKAEKSNKLEVKVRGIGRNPSGYGKVSWISEDKAKVTLENPAWAMAPGQPVVFYENDLLLGGGLMFNE